MGEHLTGDVRDTETVPPRLSAAVILARRVGVGFEIFMVRRVATATVAADAYVFPGGVVQENDYVAGPSGGEFTAADALAELTLRGSTPPRDASQALAIMKAALRELFEEAGVLLALDAVGRVVQIDEETATRIAALRRGLQGGDLTFANVLRDLQLAPAYRELRYFSHWITPIGAPHRFDTRFFVAEMPSGQAALHCQIETSESLWIRPIDLLEQAAERRATLVFPTRMHLQLLSSFGSLDDLLAFAERKPVRTVQPIRAMVEGVEKFWLPPEVEGCW